MRGLALGVPAAVFLFLLLLAFNLLQTLSLGLWLFSRRAFRRFNRECADTWWGLCVFLGQRLHGIRIVVTGDEVPLRENAVVISNHQQMPDITFLMFLARSKKRLGDMKWMVKDIIKYVPGIGWGLAFLDCLFVKRDWAADRDSIERTFSRLVQNRVPLWLMSFPEGTRLTPVKLGRAQEFARKQGLPPTQHVLVPRTRGFVASVRGLCSHAAAVYDVTIAYEQGVPTLWQYVKGFVGVAHLQVRRFPIDGLPPGDDDLAAWLLDRYQEKDRMLDHFYQHGAFPL